MNRRALNKTIPLFSTVLHIAKTTAFVIVFQAPPLLISLAMVCEHLVVLFLLPVLFYWRNAKLRRHCSSVIKEWWDSVVHR